MRSMNVARAYQKASTHRSFRDQEADVFRFVNASLRRGQGSNAISRTQAVQDNERLWIVLMDIVRDPSNQLPEHVRAGIVSVGHTVRRELASLNPDLSFMIAVNEQIAAGLTQA